MTNPETEIHKMPGEVAFKAHLARDGRSPIFTDEKSKTGMVLPLKVFRALNKPEQITVIIRPRHD